MDLDSDFISLAEAVRFLVARGSNETRAKTDICNAIVDLRLPLKVQFDQNEQGDDRGNFAETNEVEIPSTLNLHGLSWIQSRPTRPDKWRGAAYLWEARQIKNI
jgi:hypothetical protein